MRLPDVYIMLPDVCMSLPYVIWCCQMSYDAAICLYDAAGWLYDAAGCQNDAAKPHFWRQPGYLDARLSARMSKYLKYMYLRGILYFDQKYSYLTCPNTSNTWIRVFGRYSLFWSKIYLFWFTMFWIPQIHEYV